LLRGAPKGLTRREVASHCGCSYATATTALTDLVERQLAVASCGSRPVRYRVLCSCQLELELEEVDADTVDEELAALSPRGRCALELLSAEGRALTRREVATRARWAYNTAKRALAELVKQGLLVVVDTGPPARYEVPRRGRRAQTSPTSSRMREESDLSPRARRALELLRDEVGAHSRREIAVRAGWAYNTAKRALTELVDRGLVLAVVDARPPARFRLRVGR
jgi:DNA-binding transcriptional regulator YhcF (GntR family)